jgi:YVTN family beta-propeller protein
MRRRTRRAGAVTGALVMAAGLLAGCASSKHASLNRSPVTRKDPPPKAQGTATARTVETLPPAGTNVYAHTLSASDLSPAVANVPPRVYVPNSDSNTVDVIDPETMEIIDHFPTDREPQHVTPSWDMKTLYVDNDLGNTLIPIDPMTGKPGKAIPVDDPYNLYFTQDGTKAIVVAERFRRLDFRDPHTWKLLKSVPMPCSGVDHGDPTADGKEMLLSCEFSGDMVRVDVVNMELIGAVHVGGQPIDVKLSPDGSKFYVANQQRNGVSVIDARTFVETNFIPTGKGAHGLYPSRDAKRLFVSNRTGGSVSVIDLANDTVLTTWNIGGSPDMGGVSTDGKRLWLSGRYNKAVYVIDTTTGQVIKTIAVGKGAHGLCLFPQPGRFSLGHTGVYR